MATNTNQLNDIPYDQDQRDFDITDAILYRKDDVGRFLLRLSIGGLMLFHGLNKLFYGTEQIGEILNRAGIPPFFSFGVFLGEILGPILMIIGYQARLGAFLVALDMLIAILLVHAGDLTRMNELGGWMVELNMLYLLGALCVIFLGSGRYSLTKGKGAFD